MAKKMGVIIKNMCFFESDTPFYHPNPARGHHLKCIPETHPGSEDSNHEKNHE